MKLFVLAILAIPSLSFAFPNCEEGNSIPAERKAEVIAIGAGWMSNAIYCDFGTYQILAPKDNSSTEIVMFKNGKLFIMHQKGFGINLFQSYGKSDPIPYVTVQDWDNDGIFERLDYSLVDNNGRVIGHVQDKQMDGNSKTTNYNKKHNKALQSDR